MDDTPPRVYADTSVFGGPFDEEFAECSRIFFQQVRLGRFTLVTSAIVRAEIERAPEKVRALFEELLPLAELTELSEEVMALRQAYLDAGIVTVRSSDDGLHVAQATVCRDVP